MVDENRSDETDDAPSWTTTAIVITVCLLVLGGIAIVYFGPPINIGAPLTFRTPFGGVIIGSDRITVLHPTKQIKWDDADQLKSYIERLIDRPNQSQMFSVARPVKGSLFQLYTVGGKIDVMIQFGPWSTCIETEVRRRFSELQISPDVDALTSGTRFRVLRYTVSGTSEDVLNLIIPLLESDCGVEEGDELTLFYVSQ